MLSALMDAKKVAVLSVVLNSKEEMYLKEIAEKSNVPIASAFRILNELVISDILQKREWKTSKVYSSANNEKTEFLKELFYEEYDGLKEFITGTKDISGIQNIILHGGKKNGKANVLLIGRDIDTGKVEEVCARIKEKGFELSYLTLTKEQYEQMSRMGLYAGEKKVLK